MKRRYIYLPLLAGALTPWLVIHVLEVNFGTPRFHKPYIFIDDPQAILFLTALAEIPFVVLIAVMLGISKTKVGGVQRELTFWGGLISAWGLTAYAHWDVWYPIYSTWARMGSTFVVVFLFIPFYALFFLVIGLAVGYLIGWGISFLPPFQEGKKNKPAREEGEDDKFSL